MKCCHKDKDFVSYLLAFLALACAVAGIVLVVLRYVRKEYNPCDCELDLDECDDCEDLNCGQCDENGCAYTDEKDFVKE